MSRRCLTSLLSLILMVGTLVVLTKPSSVQSQNFAGYPIYLPVVRADPPPPPEDAVTVTNSRLYYRYDLYIVGELVSTRTDAVCNVQLQAKLYNAADQFVATGETDAIFSRLYPNQTSPFKFALSNSLTNITRYELSVSYQSCENYLETAEMTVLSQDISQNRYVEIAGQVRNDSDRTMWSYDVVATFYDSNGHVLDVFDTSSFTSDVLPNMVVSYNIRTGAEPFEYNSVQVRARGALAP